jgi:hypothetical protein
VQFCLALLVAAAFSDVSSKAGWRRIFRSVALWFRSLQSGESVPQTTADARLTVCRGCSLWFKPLGTCSSPLKREAADLGCWCWMEAKVRLPQAQCWLDEDCQDEVPYGWKQHGL